MNILTLNGIFCDKNPYEAINFIKNEGHGFSFRKNEVLVYNKILSFLIKNEN